MPNMGMERRLTEPTTTVGEIEFSGIDDSQRTAAKVAGLSCLFGMVIVVFANYAIFVRLIVPGNAVRTAQNILTHEVWFRIAVVCNITYAIAVIVFLAAL